jgi:hypothetical protein
MSLQNIEKSYVTSAEAMWTVSVNCERVSIECGLIWLQYNSHVLFCTNVKTFWLAYMDQSTKFVLGQS